MNAAAANRPTPMPPALTLTLSSDLASWISLQIRRGDVALGVGDQAADGGSSSDGAAALTGSVAMAGVVLCWCGLFRC